MVVIPTFSNDSIPRCPGRVLFASGGARLRGWPGASLPGRVAGTGEGLDLGDQQVIFSTSKGKSWENPGKMGKIMEDVEAITARRGGNHHISSWKIMEDLGCRGNHHEIKGFKAGEYMEHVG